MKSILLIEDDPLLIDTYKTKFKKVGFEVEVATDGEAGIEKLKEKVFDILLVDIVLPKIDGWQILKEVQKMKKENPEKFKNLKIVILSNLGEKEDIERGLKLGATKYLIKAHLTPTEIVQEIEKLF